MFHWHWLGPVVWLISSGIVWIMSLLTDWSEDSAWGNMQMRRRVCKWEHGTNLNANPVMMEEGWHRFHFYSADEDRQGDGPHCIRLVPMISWPVGLPEASALSRGCWILAGSGAGGGRPLGRSEDPSAASEEGNAAAVEESGALGRNRSPDEPLDEGTLSWSRPILPIGSLPSLPDSGFRDWLELDEKRVFFLAPLKNDCIQRWHQSGSAVPTEGGGGGGKGGGGTVSLSRRGHVIESHWRRRVACWSPTSRHF